MHAIVSSPSQVLTNIKRFEKEVGRSSELQDRLAYARAWYAYQDERGHWRFGPSKFVGYQDFDAESYIRTAASHNGRRTEAQLQQWFTVLDPASEQHAKLSEALSAWLAEFDKAPSTAMRINVLKEDDPQPPDPNDDIVELLVRVARDLPSHQLNRLRKRLGA